MATPALNQPVANPNPPVGGEIVYHNHPDGLTRYGLLRERVNPTGASTNLAQKLPAGARPIWSAMSVIAALTLVTGTNLGLGTSTNPIRFCMSGAAGAANAVTANAKHGPVWNRPQGCIYSSTAASTANAPSSASETAFAFPTTPAVPSIPANTLKPGDIIKFRVQGIVTAINATDTTTIKVKLGTSILAVTGAPQTVANDIFVIEGSAVVRTIGATGTLVAAGLTWNGTAAAAAGAADIPSGTFLASTAVDTTAANAPTVSATFSTNSATNSARVDVFYVEVVRPSENENNAFAGGSATTLQVAPVNTAGVATGTITVASGADIGCFIFFELVDPLDDVS